MKRVLLIALAAALLGGAWYVHAQKWNHHRSKSDPLIRFRAPTRAQWQDPVAIAMATLGVGFGFIGAFGRRQI